MRPVNWMRTIIDLFAFGYVPFYVVLVYALVTGGAGSS